MIRLDPFKPNDVAEIELGARGAADLTWHDRKALAEAFALAGKGLTARDPAGTVLFCGGHSERHVQRVTLWGLYAEGLTRRQWAWLLDRTRRYVAELPHRRVEAEVRAEDVMANRWALAIGLELEAVLGAASPDGGAMNLYRRIAQ